MRASSSDLVRVVLVALLSMLTAPAAGLAQESNEGAIGSANGDTEREARIAQLREMVEAYFKATDERQRRKALGSYTSYETLSLDDLAMAVRTANLWEPQEPGIREITVESDRDRGPRHITRVHVAIPEGYDPEKAYPLVLGLHPEGGTGESYVAMMQKLFDKHLDGLILAAPTDYEGMWLSSPQEATDDLPRLLVALRRLYHTDTDRVYIMGSGLGGHAAFVASALYTDYFAAGAVLGGTLALQLGAEGVDLLLPNLQSLPMLVVYGEDDPVPPDAETGAADTPSAATQPDDTEVAASGVAAWNRYIEHVADKLNLPFRMISIEGSGQEGITPPVEEIERLLSWTRPRRPERVSHWFRYPAQGRIGWLRQTEFLGEPWTAQQVVVSPAMNETPGQAMTELLKDRLAYLGGRIMGNVVHISSNNCAEVELLLSSEIIDLKRQIIIYLDGTERFRSRVPVSMKTMLEVAEREWDFQRLWSVRITIGQNGRAVVR